MACCVGITDKASYEVEEPKDNENTDYAASNLVYMADRAKEWI